MKDTLTKRRDNWESRRKMGLLFTVHVLSVSAPADGWIAIICSETPAKKWNEVHTLVAERHRNERCTCFLHPCVVYHDESHLKKNNHICMYEHFTFPS